MTLSSAQDKKHCRRCVECGGYFRKALLHQVQASECSQRVMSKRSAYLCRSMTCVQSMLKSRGKKLQRALKNAVPKHFIEELERELTAVTTSSLHHIKQTI
jgi:predicted RNA-binding protein YlxR (DUF448 family)